MDNKQNPKSHSLMELSIAQERLRQARHAFNLALGATAVSFCIGLLGAALLLFYGKVSEGAITSAGGLVSSVQCLKLAKDANDRLDKIQTELEG